MTKTCCGSIEELIRHQVIIRTGKTLALRIGGGLVFVNFCPSCGQELPLPYPKEPDVS